MKSPLSVFKPKGVYTLDRVYERMGIETSKAEVEFELTKLVEDGQLLRELQVLFDRRVIATWPDSDFHPSEVFDEARDREVPLSVCDTQFVYSLRSNGQVTQVAPLGVEGATPEHVSKLEAIVERYTLPPGKKLQKTLLAHEVSNEALKELFEPETARNLNVPLAENVLRMLAFEHVLRGGRTTEEVAEALTGPAECVHGRSRMGTCPACEDDGDEEDPGTVLEAFCGAYREGRPFDRKRLYKALCGLGYGPDTEDGAVSREEFQETLDQAALPDSDPRKRD